MQNKLWITLLVTLALADHAAWAQWGPCPGGVCPIPQMQPEARQLPRSTNFVIRGGDASLATLAESYRKSISLAWLGQEMPSWGRPSEITIGAGNRGGKTMLAFGQGGSILSQDMVVSGDINEIRDNVLPHEITHTVIAYRFRKPIPRWADEGAAQMSESYAQQEKMQAIAVEAVTAKRMIPLTQLLPMMEYPSDYRTFYAQPYSLTRFLCRKKSRGVFLTFIADGSTLGWQVAVTKHYGYASVDELQQAWVADCLGLTRPQPKPVPATVPVAPTPPATGTVAPTPATVVQGPIGPSGPIGPIGPQGTPGKDADTTALQTKIALLEKQLNDLQQRLTTQPSTTPAAPLPTRVRVEPAQQ